MTLVQARTLDALALRRVQEIYEDGFAERLRAPFEDLLRDNTLVLLDAGEPSGVAVLRELGSTGWVFLRYFVAGARGRGVGTRLWSGVCRALLAAGHTRLVYDVEDPAEHGAAEPEITVRHRRIAFYLRLGARLLPVRDYLPPHGEDTHPMLLMAADLGVERTPPIVGDDLRDVVLAVYEHRYGLTESDPVVRRTVDLLGGDGRCPDLVDQGVRAR